MPTAADETPVPGETASEGEGEAVEEEEPATTAPVGTEQEGVVEQTEEEGGSLDVESDGRKPFVTEVSEEFVNAEMAKLKTEVSVLKEELAKAMDMVKDHEEVLRVLSGLEDEESISSIKRMIQMNRKNKKKKRLQRDQIVEPVAAESTATQGRIVK